MAPTVKASSERFRKRHLGSLALACVLALGVGYYYFALFLPHAHAIRQAQGLNGSYVYGCDLHPIWLTTHELLLHRVNPYTAEMSLRNQIAVYGRPIDPRRPADPIQNLGVFPYPIYTDFLAAPLALLSFGNVQIVGTVLFPVLVAVNVFLWLWLLNLRPPLEIRLSILLLTFASYPILEGIYAQQITLLVAALLGCSAIALAKGRFATAGVLIAATSVKPQLVLLVSLWLMGWAFSDLRRRKAFLISLIGTITLLFVVGEIVLPGWTLGWIRGLYDYRHYNRPSLAQLVLGATLGNIFSVVLLAIAALLGVRACRSEAPSPKFALTFALLLAITVAVIPSSIAVYDQILLVPAVLWLFSIKTEILSGGLPLRMLGYATIAALSWQWLAGLSVAIVSLAFPGVVRTPWALLPVHAAASVPFAVVGLSLWMVWKASSRPDLQRRAREDLLFSDIG